jgi:hypothetical protein
MFIASPQSMWEDCPQAAHESRRKPAPQSRRLFPHLKGYVSFSVALGPIPIGKGRVFSGPALISNRGQTTSYASLSSRVPPTHSAY